MKKLALKIDVDTLRGTEEGVPRLVTLLQKHNAQASFLFSLGPDHTGRAIKRMFRPGFASKVSRTSVVKHYGWKTLMYGVLLPGPSIAKKCAVTMRSVRKAGFDVGIHCYDHVLWQDYVARKDLAWTEREMTKACVNFKDIFGESARIFGAAGWQINGHALRLEQSLGFEFCSDTRGDYPFLPTYQGESFSCPQLPTTLPTLDELIGLNEISEENVAAHLLKITSESSKDSEIFTLHAELEGGLFLDAFEQLLVGWRSQGYALLSLKQFFDDLDPKCFPRHEVVLGSVGGRSGTLALQGPSSVEA